MVKFTMLGSPTAWDYMRTKTEIYSATATQAEGEFSGPKGFFCFFDLRDCSFAFRCIICRCGLVKFLWSSLKGFVYLVREGRLLSLAFLKRSRMISRCFISAYNRSKDQSNKNVFLEEPNPKQNPDWFPSIIHFDARSGVTSLSAS